MADSEPGSSPFSFAATVSTTKVSVKRLRSSLAGGPLSPVLLASRVAKSRSMTAPQRWAWAEQRGPARGTVSTIGSSSAASSN